MNTTIFNKTKNGYVRKHSEYIPAEDDFYIYYYVTTEITNYLGYKVEVRVELDYSTDEAPIGNASAAEDDVVFFGRLEDCFKYIGG